MLCRTGKWSRDPSGASTKIIWSCGRTVIDAEPLPSLSWRLSLAMRYVERCTSPLVGKNEGASGLNFSWLVGTESLMQFSVEYTKWNGLLTVEMLEVHTVCRKSACLWSCLSAFGLWELMFSTLRRWLWSLAEIICPELSDILTRASHLGVEASVVTDLFGWDKMGLLLQAWSRSFYYFEEKIYFENDFCVSEMSAWQSSCIEHR